MNDKLVYESISMNIDLFILYILLSFLKIFQPKD